MDPVDRVEKRHTNVVASRSSSRRSTSRRQTIVVAITLVSEARSDMSHAVTRSGAVIEPADIAGWVRLLS